MTMRFVGVAMGVRKEAAAATATLIITGLGETPMLVAAAMPMGITIRAVAGLLMGWARIAVSRNSPARRAVGPASPTRLTRPSAISLAAPVCSIAVESGIIAPTRITVVQSMAR